MDVAQVIEQRKSIRAFKPDSVPKNVLAEILSLALRAPSTGNTQPWEFYVAGGKVLEELKEALVEKANEQPRSDFRGPATYPEPYESRRHSTAPQYLALRGIRREDREGRGWWRVQGLKLFGAPCVIVLCIDRSIFFKPDGVNVFPIFDCGLIAENIMLLALNYGLGTIPQGQVTMYPDVAKKILKIPESKLLVLGISMGYPDWADAINQLRSDREPIEKVVTYVGL